MYTPTRKQYFKILITGNSGNSLKIQKRSYIIILLFIIIEERFKYMSLTCTQCFNFFFLYSYTFYFFIDIKGTKILRYL